jgi:hypothetical protein
VINRYVRNADNELKWKSQVVTDPRVINAYINHRKQIEKPPKEEKPKAEGGEPPQIVELTEEEKKVRIKRRTNAHVIRLQIKQGKRPPLPDDDDISESELPPSPTTKAMSIVVKLPTEDKRKKRSDEVIIPSKSFFTKVKRQDAAKAPSLTCARICRE